PGDLDSTNAGRDSRDEDELGIFELFEEFERTAAALSAILDRISDHTARIGGLSNRRTQELTELAEEQRKSSHVGRAKQEDVLKAKRILDQAADDLTQFSMEMDADVQQFKLGNHLMFDILARAVAAQGELEVPSERLKEDRTTLETLASTIAET